MLSNNEGLDRLVWAALGNKTERGCGIHLKLSVHTDKDVLHSDALVRRYLNQAQDTGLVIGNPYQREGKKTHHPLIYMGNRLGTVITQPMTEVILTRTLDGSYLDATDGKQIGVRRTYDVILFGDRDTGPEVINRVKQMHGKLDLEARRGNYSARDYRAQRSTKRSISSQAYQRQLETTRDQSLIKEHVKRRAPQHPSDWYQAQNDHSEPVRSYTPREVQERQFNLFPALPVHTTKH